LFTTEKPIAMSNLDLTCEKCNTEYQKPADFKKWHDKFPSVFFKWSLQFCDTCRKEKQTAALQNLRDVIDLISEND
jgi:hypothetical protein